MPRSTDMSHHYRAQSVKVSNKGFERVDVSRRWYCQSSPLGSNHVALRTKTLFWRTVAQNVTLTRFEEYQFRRFIGKAIFQSSSQYFGYYTKLSRQQVKNKPHKCCRTKFKRQKISWKERRQMVPQPHWLASLKQSQNQQRFRCCTSKLNNNRLTQRNIVHLFLYKMAKILHPSENFVILFSSEQSSTQPNTVIYRRNSHHSTQFQGTYPSTKSMRISL